jgi:FkbM family methyltransferase
MFAGRVVKRIIEAATRCYFLNLVQEAYHHSDSRSHRKISHMAEIWYGLEPSRFLKKTISRVFIDFVYQAQLELFQGNTPIDLGPSPIGFNELKISCSSGDANSSVVYLYGFSDNLTSFEIYRQYALPGSVAIDIGANLGIHSLVLSKCVGEEGTVLSYEPISDIFRRLVDNVRLNGLANIVTKKIGVGGNAGQVGFEPNVGEFNIGKGHVDGNSPTTISITCIDDESRELPGPISMVKVDVEGFELSVLRGARSTLEMHTPAIVCEYNPNSFSFRDLTDTLPYDALYYRIPYTFWEELKPITAVNVDEPAEILVVPFSKKPAHIS